MHRCVFSSSKSVESSWRYLQRKRMDGGALGCLFCSCGCSVTRPYKQRKQPSGTSPSFLCCSARITPAFLPCLNAFPTRHLSLSLTPAFRHSDILWHNVEN